MRGGWTYDKAAAEGLLNERTKIISVALCVERARHHQLDQPRSPLWVMRWVPR